MAMKPGKQRALDKSTLLCELINLLEKTKVGTRAKAEHPFLVCRGGGSAMRKCAAEGWSRTRCNPRRRAHCKIHG